MEFDSRDVALSAVFAAMYVVVNVIQMATVGNPTVYGPVQLRVADCLIVLAAVLGWPVIGGVTLGCFLTNAFYFIGMAILSVTCFGVFLYKVVQNPLLGLSWIYQFQYPECGIK